MKRRDFLTTIGASAALAALWPRLIREAFADASFDAPGAKKTAPGLPSAVSRAQAANKPLFAIVIPADDGKKWERGGVWGEYLNHGSAAEIAPLGSVEVACATMKDLEKLAPDVKGEPLAVLVRPDGTHAVVDGRLPSYKAGGKSWQEDA